MNWIKLRLLDKIAAFAPSGGLSVTGRITLWYLILSLTPILAIGFLAYQNSRTSLEREIFNKLNAVADNKAFFIRNWFNDHVVDASNLAGNIALKDILSPTFKIIYPSLAAKTEQEREQRVRALVGVLQDANVAYLDVLIANKDGQIIISSSRILEQEGKTLKEIGLTNINPEGSFVSQVFYSPTAQQPALMTAAPVYDNNANVVGHVLLEAGLRPIHRLVEEYSGLGKSGEVIIVDRNLKMLTQSRFSEASTVLKPTPGNHAIQQGLQGNKGETVFQDYRSVQVLSAYRPLTVMGAVLIAKIDEAEGFAPVIKLRNTILGIIVLTMLLASWVAVWVARTTTRPIHAAEALEKVRADFMAMVIHDLRSPLTALLSSVAVLQDGLAGPLNKDQKEWLAKIDEGASQLLYLVNEFLDLSKLEEGRVELTKENVDLKNLIQHTLNYYSVMAQNKKISLRCRVDPSLPVTSADPRRLDQVFTNLLSNAIKFTAEGGEIELGAGPLNTSEAKVWVKDNGVGISPQEIGQLFQKYRQTESGKTTKEKGSGLGLVISKMIIEAHGGKMWVESDQGKGTTFFFSLPMNPPESTAL